MKVLYLVRHGIARNIGEEGVLRDFDRPLSSLGVERTRQVMAGLDTVMEIYPDVIHLGDVRDLTRARLASVTGGAHSHLVPYIVGVPMPGADSFECQAVKLGRSADAFSLRGQAHCARGRA